LNVGKRYRGWTEEGRCHAFEHFALSLFSGGGDAQKEKGKGGSEDARKGRLKGGGKKAQKNKKKDGNLEEII